MLLQCFQHTHTFIKSNLAQIMDICIRDGRLAQNKIMRGGLQNGRITGQQHIWALKDPNGQAN